MGGIFSQSSIRKWLFLCSGFPKSLLSGEGKDGKAVLAAASVIVGFTLGLICFFMTEKLPSSVTSLKFYGSGENRAETFGFCTIYF
jgi:hypothetical protein